MAPESNFRCAEWNRPDLLAGESVFTGGSILTVLGELGCVRSNVEGGFLCCLFSVRSQGAPPQKAAHRGRRELIPESPQSAYVCIVTHMY